MAKEKIPFIYNYCDRWCERCAFTARCLVFEQEQQDPSPTDMDSTAFWDRLAENFSKARHLIEKVAKERGIDLEELAKHSDELDEEHDRIRRDAKNHPLAKLSFEYLDVCRTWIKNQPGMIEKLESLRVALDEDDRSILKNARETTDTITECLGVVQWYQTFIPPKIMRALSGRMRDSDFFDDYQQDYNGSAKVALIGIERSMQAWVKLFDLLPEREDDFLHLLSMLEKMKMMLLKEFPDALKFIRPGFDDSAG